jgi:hypothetical protein
VKFNVPSGGTEIFLSCPRYQVLLAALEEDLRFFIINTFPRVLYRFADYSRAVGIYKSVAFIYMLVTIVLL